MPHIPPLPTDRAGEARTALETLQEKLGQVPNMYRTFAHAPRVLDAVVLMAQAIRTDRAGEARTALETLQEKLGQVPNMYRTFAHAPRVLDAVVLMAQAIRTDLDAKLRELAYLKVTHMTACHVCWYYHETAARRIGVTEQQIRDLGSVEPSDAYSPLEKDVLRFAEQWTLRGRIADDVMARLKTALPPGHLVLLAATTAQANLTTRFNNVFEVELP